LILEKHSERMLLIATQWNQKISQ